MAGEYWLGDNSVTEVVVAPEHIDQKERYEKGVLSQLERGDWIKASNGEIGTIQYFVQRNRNGTKWIRASRKNADGVWIETPELGGFGLHKSNIVDKVSPPLATKRNVGYATNHEGKIVSNPKPEAQPKVLALPQSAPYSMRELQEKNAGRRTTSSLIDSMRSHKITVTPDNPRVRRWAKDPGSMDVLGIDNPPSITQPTRIAGRRMPRISPRTPRLR